MPGTLIKLTNAGRAALVGPENVGTVTRTITQIGVSTAHFVHNDELLVLPNELKKLATFGGENVAPDTVHVTLRDDTADQYTLYGFGLYLDNGVLFGTYSQETPILEKSPAAMMLLSADMLFTTIDAALLQFGSAEWTNPPATESRQGVAEIATQGEADGGLDDTRIITPKKLAARIAALVNGAPVGLDTLGEIANAIALLAPIASPVFTGNPAAPTPAQFDNDTSIATTEHVKRALGSRRAIIGLAANTQLTVAHVGTLIGCNSPGDYTLTLPPYTGLPSGSSITFVHSTGNANGVTIVASGAEVIRSEGNAVPSLVLGVNQCLTLTTDGGTGWYLEMQNMYGNTAPQFDASSKLATMGAVQRASGNLAGIKAEPNSRALTAADAGFLLGVTTGGITLTLPDKATLADGTRFWLKNTVGTSYFTLAAPGGDVITITHGLLPASINVDVGEDAEITKFGTSWVLTGGTVLRRLPSFAASFAGNGYQKLPSGLLLQWGNFTGQGTGNSVGITFPIAFPNACQALVAMGANANTAPTEVWRNSAVSGPTQTGATLVASNTNTNFFIALGN